jgi:hypothetical protein
MSHRVFRSPSSGSAAAAVAPSRIAAEVDGRARWRELPNGELEVATLSDGGQLERFRVEQDGSTTPLGSSPARHGRMWSIPTIIAGIVLFVGTPIFLTITDPADSGEHPFAMVTVLIGFALIGLGAVAHHTGGDIDARLKKAYGKKARWNEPTNLEGWTPRSAAQLRKVEQLADEHGGVAFVRDVGARTIEVYTRGRSRFEHYWVSEDGSAELIDSASVGGHFILDRALQMACGGCFVAAFVGALVVDHHKGLLVIVAVGGIAATMLAAGLNEWSMSVERRVKRTRSAGDAWHRIGTWVEEGD